MKRILAAVIFALSSLAAHATTLDFNFTFINAVNGGGTVTGIVRGLVDNATVAATSVEVLTNTDGFGIGEYVGDPIANSFTVSSGVVTAFDFSSYGSLNSAPEVTDSSLGFGADFHSGLSNSTYSIAFNPRYSVTFTPATAAVPLPAGAVLLLSGLGGIAVMRRKRAA